jgi:hypothetical protein
MTEFEILRAIQADLAGRSFSDTCAICKGTRSLERGKDLKPANAPSRTGAHSQQQGWKTIEGVFAAVDWTEVQYRGIRWRREKKSLLQARAPGGFASCSDFKHRTKARVVVGLTAAVSCLASLALLIHQK